MTKLCRYLLVVKLCKASFLAFLVSLFFGATAFAFRISPMVADFSIPANGLSQVFAIENPGKEKIPLQIEITTRVQDELGEEKRVTSQDFSIYPEQLVLQAGEKRNLRVTYVGNRELKTEVPYRLIVTQLPVDFKKQKADANVKVNFLLQYVASLYVQPKSIKSSVQLKSFRVLGPKALEVLIENSGTKRQMLIESSVQFFDVDKNTIGKIEQVKEIEGLNILAGSVRKVVVQLEKEVPVKLKSVGLLFKQVD